MLHKTKLSELFYIFKCAMLILSAIIGAGLASGQEVVVFFAQYGFVSIFFLIILFFLFFYGIKLFLSTKSREYSVQFFKRKIRIVKVFDIISLLIFLIIGSAMIACVDELLSQVICKFSFPFWNILAILISSIVILLGFRALLNLSAYLIPFIIIGIIYICFQSNAISSTSPPTFSSDIFGLVFLSLNSVSYCCCNLIVSNKLLFNLGNKLNKKQVKWVSLIVAGTLVVIIGIIIISILINDKMVLFSDLPLVYMSFLIGDGAGYFFSAVMLISVLTTLFATQYSFHEILNLKNKYLMVVISSIAFFTLSLFGFGEIIKYFYPVIGGLGLIMSFYLRNLTLKPSFDLADDKVHSPR